MGVASQFSDSNIGRHGKKHDHHAIIVVANEGNTHNPSSEDHFQMNHEDASGSGSSVANESSTGTSDSRASREEEVLVKHDTKRIHRLKLLLFGVMFLVAVGVCLAVHMVTTDGQQKEFELAFSSAAKKVIQASRDILVRRVEAITTMSVTLTIYANDLNQTWPFVTVSDFQRRAASVKASSGAKSVAILPAVNRQNFEEWGSYSVANAAWIQEGRVYQTEIGIPEILNPVNTTPVFPPFVYSVDEEDPDSFLGPDLSSETMFPIWQHSPIPAVDFVNMNMFTTPFFSQFRTSQTFSRGTVALGGLLTAPPGNISSSDALTAMLSFWMSLDSKEPVHYDGEPMSSILVPIMGSFDNDRASVGFLMAYIWWSDYFRGILSRGTMPVQVVLENECDGAFTFTIDGLDVVYNGPGNLVDPNFKDIMMSTKIASRDIVFQKETLAIGLTDPCYLEIRVYPTKEGVDAHNDNFPATITSIVAAVFLFTVFMFVLYDHLVEVRQKKVMDTAQRSNAIVSSIFPKKVRDQLMNTAAPVQGNATKLRQIASRPAAIFEGGRAEKSAAGDGTMDQGDGIGSRPIADLFPDCTVVFADIEGFTAWSSVREPSQVFTLLETIYSTFDKIAKKHGVFKVETVGDCYVAVSGLPEPCTDHALVAVRFARDCIEKHIQTVKKLEMSLGPDTGDLRLRVGLNSGPITAGVLRGERTRFQLFGDTVNTGSRIETSGKGNCIHISDVTAAHIREAGYGNWLIERKDPVQLKGKGNMKTFWVNLRVSKAPSREISGSSGSETASSDGNEGSLSAESDERRLSTKGNIQVGMEKADMEIKTERMIKWNAQILIRHIQEIVAHRNSRGSSRSKLTKWSPRNRAPIDEVKEVIELPDHHRSVHFVDPDSVQLEPHIKELVIEYVRSLAGLYQNNPFHNFEHAGHVTMSVSKLLSRIVAPSDMNFADGRDAKKKLHDHTYGITSDPLTQFGCVLAALIHDADHQGVTNSTLIQEDSPLVDIYGGKSVAEQNSVDLAWELLMEERYQPLVKVLCHDDEELARLRQLVINVVLATDIMDPDLKKLRNDRWDKAFSTSRQCLERSSMLADLIREDTNRKATIVIEHLIQASDVAHTMQHWNVYTKWNARLFKEMYKAYLEGRQGAKNPADFWAKGEIGFFDFYIIPLAKKLKECGVFGVSSEEYLNYAKANRDEWERKGEDIVQDLIVQVHGEFGVKH